MPVDEKRKKLIQQILGDPELFPDSFKSWLSGHVQRDPNIIWERSQIPILPFSKLNWSVGTSPPSSPSDEDLWVYAGSGFYWLFMYDSSEATYKWKFVGGPPIVASGGSINTNSITFVDVTSGPAITVPRSGDYVSRGKCRAAVQVATLTDAFLRNTFTTTGAGPAGSVTLPNVQFSASDPVAEDNMAGLTGGETYKPQVRCGQANNVIFSEVVISLLPRRVS